MPDWTEALSFELLTDLLESSTAGVWVWHVEEDRVEWSERLRETLGHTEPPRTVNGIHELTHPDERASLASAIEGHLERNEPYRLDVRLRTASGDYRWMQARGVSRRDRDGAVEVLVGYVVDVSDRTAQIEELRLSEARFRAFMDNAPVGVYLKDADRVHLYVNGPAAEIAGVRPEDMMGRNHHAIFPRDTAALLDRLDDEVMESGELRTRTAFLRRADGTERWVHDVKFPIELRGGARAVGGVAVDLSELRTAQLKAAASERLESVGRLAGGVAHDFNNMLNVVLGYIDAALEELPADEPVRAGLEIAREAGERSAALTRQLLGFARKQTIQPRALRIGEQAEELARMLGKFIPADVTLEVHREPGEPQVKLDPAQLDQLLTNLIVNARDAIAGPGRIDVEVRRWDQTGRTSWFRDVPEGRYVELSVRDDGTGIPSELRSTIFEPFVTSKSMGEGTGLGLATVYGVVKQNGGFIEVESDEGVGSCFRLLFPAHRAGTAGRAPAAERNANGPAPGRGTILVVEDDPNVLRLLVGFLEREGHEVLATTDPGEAIGILGERAVDLLLTDVVMPGKSGGSVAEALESAQPGTPVVYMSGYPAESLAERGVVQGALTFLQKPFRRGELLAIVNRTLRRRA
jgi:PAS domain S-box-containing protein